MDLKVAMGRHEEHTARVNNGSVVVGPFTVEVPLTFQQGVPKYPDPGEYCIRFEISDYQRYSYEELLSRLVKAVAYSIKDELFLEKKGETNDT